MQINIKTLFFRTIFAGTLKRNAYISLLIVLILTKMDISFASDLKYFLIKENLSSLKNIRNSMAIDSNSYPHVCYFYPYAGIEYAKWQGAKWEISRIESGTSDDSFSTPSTSLVLTKNDEPYLCYINKSTKISNTNVLKIAKKIGLEWEIYELCAMFDNPYVSLCIDTNSICHIVCNKLDKTDQYGKHYSLEYIKWKDSIISNATIDSGSFSNISAYLSSNGFLYVSYIKENSIGYAYYNGISWATQIIDSSGYFISSCISVDSTGCVRIVYYDGYNKIYKCARLVDGSWSIEQIAGEGSGAISIVPDSNNGSHMIYSIYDRSHSHLVYTHILNNRNKTDIFNIWEYYFPDDYDRELNNFSLIIDKNNYLHFCYYNRSYANPGLYYLTNSPDIVRVPSYTPIKIEEIDNLFYPLKGEKCSFNLALVNDYQTKIDIYTIDGEKIKSVLSEPKISGNYVINWDGRNDNGKLVSTGVYVIIFQLGDIIEHRKIVLLK